MGGICGGKHICSSESILRRARSLSLYVNYVEEKFFCCIYIAWCLGDNRSALGNSRPLQVPLSFDRLAFLLEPLGQRVHFWSHDHVPFFHNLHFVVNHFIPVSHQIRSMAPQIMFYFICFAATFFPFSFYYFRNTHLL